MCCPRWHSRICCAAPGPLRRRTGSHVALAGLVTFAVSLSWMSVVIARPQDQRPYVDGTTNDSLFSQVFDYNGISRLEHRQIPWRRPGQPRFIAQASRPGRSPRQPDPSDRSSWHRLLTGPLGRDDGWHLPARVLPPQSSGRAGAFRGDGCAQRSGSGFGGRRSSSVFSFGRYLNSYYVAALSPAPRALRGRRRAAVARTTPAGCPHLACGHGARISRLRRLPLARWKSLPTCSLALLLELSLPAPLCSRPSPVTRAQPLCASQLSLAVRFYLPRARQRSPSSGGSARSTRRMRLPPPLADRNQPRSRSV